MKSTILKFLFLTTFFCSCVQTNVSKKVKFSNEENESSQTNPNSAETDSGPKTDSVTIPKVLVLKINEIKDIAITRSELQQIEISFNLDAEDCKSSCPNNLYLYERLQDHHNLIGNSPANNDKTFKFTWKVKADQKIINLSAKLRNDFFCTSGNCESNFFLLNDINIPPYIDQTTPPKLSVIENSIKRISSPNGDDTINFRFSIELPQNIILSTNSKMSLFQVDRNGRVINLLEEFKISEKIFEASIRPRTNEDVYISASLTANGQNSRMSSPFFLIEAQEENYSAHDYKIIDFEKYPLGALKGQDVQKSEELSGGRSMGIYLVSPQGRSFSSIPKNAVEVMYSNYNSREISKKYKLSGSKSLRLQNNGKDINYGINSDISGKKARNELIWASDQYFFSSGQDINKNGVIEKTEDLGNQIEGLGWTHGEVREISVNYFWPCNENADWMTCNNNRPSDAGDGRAIIFQVFGFRSDLEKYSSDNSPIVHLMMYPNRTLILSYSFSRDRRSNFDSELTNNSAIEEGHISIVFPASVKMLADQWTNFKILYTKHYLPEKSHIKVSIGPSGKDSIPIYDSHDIKTFLQNGGEIKILDSFNPKYKMKYSIKKSASNGISASFQSYGTPAKFLNNSEIEKYLIKNNKLLFGTSPQKFTRSNVKTGLYVSGNLVKQENSKTPVVVYLDDLQIKKLNPTQSNILEFLNRYNFFD